MLPNFLICGIQKGGTTSLYKYLCGHPEIVMAKIKEVNFFTFHYEKGSRWYELHFSHRLEEKAVGEASPLYMWYPEVAGRIANLIPQARLIFILRNPIDRAYSNYLFNISRGAQDPNVSFLEAVKTEDGYQRYITKGFYAKQLMKFLKFFNKDQLLILFSEILKVEPRETLFTCFKFLKVDDKYLPNISRSDNVTLLGNNCYSNRIYYLWNVFKYKINPVSPYFLKEYSREVRRRIHGNFFTGVTAPLLEKTDRQELSSIFKEEVELLRDLIGQEISCWDI